ncbi:MAG TPA: hypothetical protein VHV78_17385 [Gemmatimonadaceae bacterium]|jgi:hypothetical protein|nr:hypothetical protein [Gemmatimonadaceae bacterium]
MIRSRKGFTIIEGTVATAVTSLIVAVLAHSPVGQSVRLVANRRSALKYEAAKFESVSFTSLAAWSTKDRDVTRGTFSYTRQLKMTTIDPQHYTVQIIVIPKENPAKKDSVSVSVDVTL